MIKRGHRSMPSYINENIVGPKERFKPVLYHSIPMSSVCMWYNKGRWMVQQGPDPPLETFLQRQKVSSLRCPLNQLWAVPAHTINRSGERWDISQNGPGNSIPTGTRILTGHLGIFATQGKISRTAVKAWTCRLRSEGISQVMLSYFEFCINRSP